MLINIEHERKHFHAIEGVAHIVISLDADGKTTLQGYFNDCFDSMYCAMPDDRLLQREVPKLLAELRKQIQMLSGSTVTE